MIPSTAELRLFLMEAFSDEELNALCFDYFRDVHNDFTSGQTKGRRIQLLIEYCQRHDMHSNLTVALRRVRPEQYTKRFSAIDLLVQLDKRERDPKQVFISHAHQDAAFAHRLAHDLKMEDWKVWIVPESIQPGEKWPEAIQRGLDESGVFIAVLTPDAANSRWVQTETGAAITLENRDLIRFIPIELVNCEVPSLWNVYQRVDFKADYALGISNLLAALRTHEEAIELIAQAKTLLKQQRFDEAVALSRKGYQRQPTSGRLRQIYCDALYQGGDYWYHTLGDFPKASQTFQELLTIGADNKAVHQLLEEVKRLLAIQDLLRRRHFDEAITLSRDVYQHQPTNERLRDTHLEALHQGGICWYLTKDLPKAAHAFQEIVEINPYYENASQLLDEINKLLRVSEFLLRHNYDGAVRLSREIYQRQPTNEHLREMHLEALYQSGDYWYHTAGDLPKAARAFQEIIRINPSYKNAAQLLDEIKQLLAIQDLLEQQCFDEAVALSREGCERQPANERLREMHLQVLHQGGDYWYHTIGDFPKARRAFQELLTIDAGNETARQLLGEVEQLLKIRDLLARQHFDEAVALSRKWYQSQPTNERMRETYLEALHQSGDYWYHAKEGLPQAKGAFQELIKIDAGNETARQLLGEIEQLLRIQDLLERQRFDEAVALSREGYQRQPTSERLREVYCDALYQGGDYWYHTTGNLPEATDAFQEIVHINPSYKNAAQLHDEIKQVPAPPVFAKRVAAPTRPKRSWFPLGIALISLLACVAIWMIVSKFQQQSELIQAAGAPPTPVITSTVALTKTPNPTSSPTATATPTPNLGRLTYIGQDSKGNNVLYIGKPGETPVPVTQGYPDARLIAVSPDRRHFAIVVGQDLLKNHPASPRFLTDGAETVSLWVWSVDDEKLHKIKLLEPAVDATFLDDERLVVAVLKNDIIDYTVYSADGSEEKTLYASRNAFPTSTPTATPTAVPPSPTLILVTPIVIPATQKVTL